MYGKRTVLEAKGFCRGVVTSGADATYKIFTQEPGSYGSTRVWFGSSLVPDLPPFGPRHIHVVVYHPTHKLLVTQLYFKSDPARLEDWRSILSELPDSVGSLNERLTLEVSPDGTATFDFILEPLGVGEKQPGTRTEALVARCGHLVPPVPGLCHLEAAKLFRVETFYALVVLLIFSLYFCCSCSGSQDKRKAE
eukprot:TRINITY_DN1457_c0_g1_i1.p1 TRINITY_DN1457_c0_g1~~TRINITY_DN1457_c0_g1_i1.p1  ORF type:complete len:194 (-),score=20.97 TRINITY_DN1457_c0_g1_i1:168-749(-)